MKRSIAEGIASVVNSDAFLIGVVLATVGVVIYSLYAVIGLHRELRRNKK